MVAIKDFVANTAWLWFALLALLLLAAIGWAFQRESREKLNDDSRDPARNVEKGSKDDLTKIEGIGPKVAQVLKDADITTFDDLARADTAHVKQVLNDAGLQMMNPEGWIDQAKLAAKGDWDGLEELQEKLKGGRKA